MSKMPVAKINQNTKALLVGDNPFHNISHLSQERTRLRDKTVLVPESAADLILSAIDNGANGFMFSVSETTLAILRALREKERIDQLDLYAIVPYAYEYVRLSTQAGGIPGLTKKVVGRIVATGNLKGLATGFLGFLLTDPERLLKTYLIYEINKIRAGAGRKSKLESVMLHEVITDLALALNLDSIFKAHIDYMSRLGVTPGFNTCNFVYLIDKFREWNIELEQVVIASPFNKIGFQMTASQEDNEAALRSLPKPIVIAISVLAAGYLKPLEALEYISTLPNLRGLAIGVSNKSHAIDTFKLVKQKFGK